MTGHEEKPPRYPLEADAAEWGQTSFVLSASVTPTPLIAPEALIKPSQSLPVSRTTASSPAESY